MNVFLAGEVNWLYLLIPISFYWICVFGFWESKMSAFVFLSVYAATLQFLLFDLFASSLVGLSTVGWATFRIIAVVFCLGHIFLAYKMKVVLNFGITSHLPGKGLFFSEDSSSGDDCSKK